MRVEHSFKAMGGPCRIRLDAEDESLARPAISAAVAEVERLESKFSRYREDSLTARINRAAGSGEPIPVDAETVALLNYADTAWRESAGLFDLTSGVLRRAWNFKSGSLPSAEALNALLPLVDWSSVRWRDGAVSLAREGMEIDFGGCVKEYAADSAAAKLQEHGAACALVDLAGDMAATGAPAGQAGWRIGIRHPLEREQAIANVSLPAGGLASSGDYERCMLIKGERYGHILHPHTGWPVRGLTAVSIRAPQCLVAGSSATIAMLKSAEEALGWLQALGLPWFAIDRQLNCHGNIAAG
ncbi:MAG: FAD:protein FMN transferase [Halioglobus sp.]